MTIPATLDPPAAAARRWDAIVIGAGPAGALTARQLALRGLAVLLVDRGTFPRWKVCGACLNAAALSTLAAVGLEWVAIQHGAVPLLDMQLAAGTERTKIPLVGRAALSRSALDAALVDAAIRAGANWLPRTWARPHSITTAERCVALRQDGNEVLAAARIVVAAGGLGGADEVRPVVQVGARFGAGTVAAEAPAAYRPGTIYMACGSGGYVGLVRIEDGKLNIAGALDYNAVRQHRGIGALAAAILAEAGLPAVASLAHLPWRGTPALTRHTVRPAAERLFVVGDAASYVEPFTGEGIAWALAAAVAVTPIVGRACTRWDPVLAAEWSARHRRIVQCRQWPCRLLAALLRRPALTRTVVRLVRRMPLLAVPLMRLLDRSAIGPRPRFVAPG